ncbi:MAG: hypothetical protein AAGN46_10920 [Acidobacteriota bacterium]
MKSSSARRAALLLAALPPILIIGLVARYGVDLPHWDQFEMVPLFQALADGRLGWHQLWAPHNEHRLLLPKAIMLGMGHLTRWNLWWELALNIILALGALGIFGQLLLRDLRMDDAQQPAGWRAWAALPIASMLIFSPLQWENWIWGWQIQIFLAALLTFATVAILARDDGGSWRRLGAAASTTLAAGCSFGSSLFLWPAALPLVVAGPRDVSNGRRLARGVIWCVVAVVFGMVYLQDIARDSPPIEDPVAATKLVVSYVAIYLGKAIIGFYGWQSLHGGVGLAACTAILAFLRLDQAWRSAHRNAWLRAALPYATFLAFATLVALATASGRAHLGLEQALSSRYNTLANFFWLGALGLWTVKPPTPAPEPWIARARLAIRCAALATFLAIFINANRLAPRILHDQHQGRIEIRQNLQASIDVDSDALAFLFPHEALVRQHLAWLEAERYSLFRSSDPRPTDPNGTAAGGEEER